MPAVPADPAPAAERADTPIWVAWPLLWAATLTVMAGAIVAPALPGLRAALDPPWPNLLVPLVLTLPGLAIAIGAPLIGRVLPRLDRRRFLLALLIGYAIVGGSAAFISDIFGILATRLGLGMVIACLMTTVTSLQAEYFIGERRIRVIGWQSSAMAFGGVIYLPLGGLLASYDWQWAFFAYGMAFVLVPLIWLIPAVPVRAPEPPRPIPKGGGAAVVLVLAGLSMATFYVVPIKLPFLLIERDAEDPLTAGLAIGAMTLVVAVLGFLFPLLRRKIGTRVMDIAGFAMLSAGLAGTALSTSLLQVFPAMVLCGLGQGLVFPTFSARLLETAPDPATRARRSGQLVGAIFLGQFVSPLLFAYPASIGGADGAFFAASALGAAAGVFAATRR